MALSIQTNVPSLIAQENLRVTNDFQNQTIQRLTSGYRINTSADDAAGLAVANKYRSDVSELTQGVRNANDGLSALQIVDGGLSNISKMLDRLKALATQSASGTFTGNRTTLNNEYSSVLLEINRQANNMGMVSGGAFNKILEAYVGGGNTQANSKVAVDLSGAANRVDATSMGIGNTSIVGGGENALVGNSVDLRTGTFLAGSVQAFTFHFYNQDVVVNVGNGSAAITGQNAVDQLNAALAPYGVTASIITDTTSADVGELQFTGGSTPFTVLVGAVAGGGGAAVATATATGQNTASYYVHNATAFGDVTAASEILTFVNSAGTTAVTLANATTWTIDSALTYLNGQLNSKGIYALKNDAGTGIEFQGASSFTLTASGTPTGGVFGADGAKTVTAPAAAASVTGNALDALTKLGDAITYLGLIQGKVGTGQNKFQYAIQLAQSQISSFSAAESRIRDADMAAEAANLTKAQVMQQASMAAMAQANAAPQAVLALLRG